MICTFFGHRDTQNVIREPLKTEILKLISCRVREFYVGNNGNFDLIVQNVLFELLQSKFDIKVSIVLSSIAEKAISGYQELTVFPEELSSVFKKFAINKRNEYMIKKATHVIAYVSDVATCSAKWLSIAKKANKKIINLCEK